MPQTVSPIGTTDSLAKITKTHNHHHHSNNSSHDKNKNNSSRNNSNNNSSSSSSQGQDLNSNLERHEIKSGKLLLQHRLGSRSTWLPVFVRVYRNAFEHFAVVSRDQAISMHSSYVNLRTTSCAVREEDGVTQFQVVHNDHEGTVGRFDARHKDALSDWVEAFTCATPPTSPTRCGGFATLTPAIPRSPVMPPLPEVDEEE